MGNRIYRGKVKVIRENAKHDSVEPPQDQIRIIGKAIQRKTNFTHLISISPYSRNMCLPRLNICDRESRLL